MCKAANVKLIGWERTNPALITVQIIGETGAVKTAVEAGAAAASRVGYLVSTHVIPRPDLQLDKILLITPDEDENSSTQEVEEKPVNKAFAPKKVVQKAVEPEVIPRTLKTEVTPVTPATKVAKTKSVIDPQLMDLKVTDLRTLARATQDFPIKGRDISKANKEELLKFFEQIGRG